MIGVNYEQFWTLNPKSLSPFVKAFVLKQQYDDMNAWSQGRYIMLAVASLFDKKTKYPTKPFLNSIDSNGNPKETKQEEIKRKFMERMEIINTRFVGGESE